MLPFRARFRRISQTVAALALASAAAAASAQDVTVFAAASLTNALEEIAKIYREKGGEE